MGLDDNVNLGPEFFLKAPEAWEKIENDDLSPKGFGIPGAKGLGIVLRNYYRDNDIAGIMKHEMNPWKSWNRYRTLIDLYLREAVAQIPDFVIICEYHMTFVNEAKKRRF